MSTHSLVYFLAAHSVCRVKIGFTADFPTRFKQLQSACPVKLTILGCVPGGCDEEGVFHDQFAPYRNDWEWFTLGAAVHKDILKILSDSELRLRANTHNKIREWIRSQISDVYVLVEEHKRAFANRTKKTFEERGVTGKPTGYLLTQEKIDLTGVDLGVPLKRVAR